VRRQHLELLGFAYGRVPPPLEEIHGNTMVDRHFMPLGFCFAWFEPSGTVSLHAHFGKWLRQFPKDVLRGMHGTANELRTGGVRFLHATADPSIEGSLRLVEWLKGVHTGQTGEFGPVYLIDLHKTKI
jgi:hypothetical protein